MSVVFSGTSQGGFVATGGNEIITLRHDVDWMWVKNLTVSYAGGAGTGAEFYWQRGMQQGTGTIYTKTAVTNALAVAQMAAPTGFYLVDTTVNVPGPGIATTGITGALPPVVTTGNTAGLAAGDIVRLFAPAGALQLGGMDFSVSSVVANTSFVLRDMPAIAAATPLSGIYRRIPYDPYFYPRTRLITKITQSNPALVTLSVTHTFVVGQKIRFIIPTVTAASYGMTELDGIEATIIGQNLTDGTSTNTILVDVDTTGFTAFALPLTANPVHTFAQAVPVGENTATAINNGFPLIADASFNTGTLGMQLTAGANSPAGVVGNVITWVAGKSFSV